MYYLSIMTLLHFHATLEVGFKAFIDGRLGTPQGHRSSLHYY